MAVRRIVAYDVSSDKARARIAALCGRHGLRRQRSVFEITLDDSDLQAFLERCEELIDLDHDAVVVVTECEHRHGRRQAVGQAGPDLDAGYWIVGFDPDQEPIAVSEKLEMPSGARSKSPVQGVDGAEVGPFDALPGEWRAMGQQKSCSDPTKKG